MKKKKNTLDDLIKKHTKKQTKEIHVLFDLDKTLSESLDHLIMDTSNMSIFGAQRKSLNDLIGRASWRECLAHIRSTFDRLADPDAAEIAH